MKQLGFVGLMIVGFLLWQCGSDKSMPENSNNSVSSVSGGAGDTEDTPPLPTPIGGRLIVFDANDEVYVINGNGTGKLRLTNNEAQGTKPAVHGDGTMPRWSPDGKQIVFVASPPDENNGSEIFLMDADGSNVRQLTHHDVPTMYPEFSPDGQFIAFYSDSPYRELNVVRISFLGNKQLTDEGFGTVEPRISWSPDSSRIAFAASTSRNRTKIYTVGVDGSPPVLLNDTEYNEVFPAWSPDGTRIAFASLDSEEVQSLDIYTVNLDGSNLVPLTDNFVPDIYPVWSPGGKRIAFLRGDEGARSFDLYVMEVDGSNVTQLTNYSLGIFQFDEGSIPITWSPDGNYITFKTVRFDKYPPEIFVVNVNEQEVNRFVE